MKWLNSNSMRLVLMGIVAVLVFSAGNAWGAGFLDDFNRPDGEVGNGWETWTEENIEIKIVDREVLIAGQQVHNWWRSEIYRPVEDETRFSFDFKADDNFNVHIHIFDAEDSQMNMDVYAWPDGPFSYMWHLAPGVWTDWTRIDGLNMIANQYNNLLLEQKDSEFILTLNGQVVGTIMNQGITRIGEVSIAADAAATVVGSLHIDNVQMETVMAEKARNPSPEDGAMHEDTWVTLSWTSGDWTVSHDVYLGEDFNDVNDAMLDSEVYRGNQTEVYYVAGFPGYAYPEGLVRGTPYYWRIDEVNDADPNSPWKGDVWSFTIQPKTVFNPDPADGAEIEDTEVILRWMSGSRAILHTVYFGDNYDEVNNAAVGVSTEDAFYDPGELEREKVYYWRVDEFDGHDTYKGDIWTFTTLGAVGHP